MENKEIVSLIIYGTQRRESQISTIEMQELCAQLSGNFSAFAYYHSHKSQSKGGRFSPHIHLVLAIPNEEFPHWYHSVEKEWNTSSLSRNYRLCDIRDQRTKVKDLGKLMTYLYGSKRRQLPLPVYWTSDWFDFEKSIVGYSHLDRKDAA